VSAREADIDLIERESRCEGIDSIEEFQAVAVSKFFRLPADVVNVLHLLKSWLTSTGSPSTWA
jgi:hypothetical protein